MRGAADIGGQAESHSLHPFCTPCIHLNAEKKYMPILNKATFEGNKQPLPHAVPCFVIAQSRTALLLFSEHPFLSLSAVCSGVGKVGALLLLPWLHCAHTGGAAFEPKGALPGF